MLGEDGHLCISLRILSIKTPCLVRIYSTLSRSCVRRGTLLGRKVEGVHVWGNGVGEGEGKWKKGGYLLWVAACAAACAAASSSCETAPFSIILSGAPPGSYDRLSAVRIKSCCDIRVGLRFGLAAATSG